MLLVVGLVVAACGTSETAEPTIVPTTVDAAATRGEEELAQLQYEEDVKAIKELWRRHSDSWLSSNAPQSAFEYLEEHNYPGMACTSEGFEDNYGELEDGYAEEVIVDVDTVERDDGWAIPGGGFEGIIPEGRIYIFSMTITVSSPDRLPTVEEIEVHAVIQEDGTAYYFTACG